MTDRHIRILRLMAQQTWQDLRNHDAAEHDGDPKEAAWRQHLERAATRASARVTEAQARRRHRP